MSPPIHTLAGSQTALFLLNSRVSLVTVPCNRRHESTNAGTPYTEGTGLICRVPLSRLFLEAVGFSPRGTCVGSWYRCLRFFPTFFSRSPGISQTPQREAHQNLIKFSSLRYSLDLSFLTHQTRCVGLSRRIKNRTCVAMHT